jgi:hypothetical protein
MRKSKKLESTAERVLKVALSLMLTTWLFVMPTGAIAFAAEPSASGGEAAAQNEKAAPSDESKKPAPDEGEKPAPEVKQEPAEPESTPPEPTPEKEPSPVATGEESEPSANNTVVSEKEEKTEDVKTQGLEPMDDPEPEPEPEPEPLLKPTLQAVCAPVDDGRPNGEAVVQFIFEVADENPLPLPASETPLVSVFYNDVLIKIFKMSDFVESEPESGIYTSPSLALASLGRYAFEPENDVVDFAAGPQNHIVSTLGLAENFDSVNITYTQTKSLQEIASLHGYSIDTLRGPEIIGGTVETASTPDLFALSYQGTVSFTGYQEVKTNSLARLLVADYLTLTEWPLALKAQDATKDILKPNGSGDERADAVFVVRVYTADGAYRDLRITVLRAVISLHSAGGDYLEYDAYGDEPDSLEIIDQINADAFIDAHISAYKNEANGALIPILSPATTFFSPAEKPLSLGVETSNPYPGFDARLLVTLNTAAVLSDAANFEYTASNPSFEARFLLEENISPYTLIWTEKGQQARLGDPTDAEGQKIWVNTRSVYLENKDSNNDLTFYEKQERWNQHDPSYNDTASNPAPLIGFDRITNYYAKNNKVTSSGAPRATLPFEAIHYDPDAPRLNAVELSEPTRQPNSGTYVYTGEEAVVEFLVSDIAGNRQGAEASGIDTDTLRVSYRGEATSQSLPYTLKADGATGGYRVSVTLGLQENPWEINRFSLSLGDYANNSATLHPTASTEEIRTIVIDQAEPAISLRFNNNNAQNEIYYNAPRTATITILEAQFDTILRFDPNQSVVTVKTDTGSTSKIPASQFSNPSGDKITWVYSQEFSADGDYTIEAAFTDISGRSVSVDSQHFIIDLTSPLLIVEFDDSVPFIDDFYNTTRTATVEVLERNFSSDLVVVSTTATDVEGNSVGGPGVAGWMSSSEDGHTARVHFGEELHYTMQASATDLAGNVAEVVEVPAFSIDLTKPTIVVENVEHTQAYAGSVAPKVTLSDTNFYEFGTEVTLSRVTGDYADWRSSEVMVDSTTQRVTFGDLSHELENDDVYVMTSTITDKAGNEVTDVRMFSVNRFGSTYLFSEDTEAIIGAYLNSPQDCTVIEINPSGIQENETTVSLKLNSETRTLAKGADYRLEGDNRITLWTDYTYTIPAQQFSDDGHYELFFRSIDLAGNLSENTMENKWLHRVSESWQAAGVNASSANSSLYDRYTREGSAYLPFVLDETDPKGSFANLNEGAVLTANMELRVNFEDNIAYDHATLLFDEVAVTEFQAEGITTTGTGTYTLSGSAFPQKISLVVYDKAGNFTQIDRSDLRIEESLIPGWSGWSNLADNGFNWPAAVAIVLGALVVLASTLLLLRRKKKRAEDDSISFANTGNKR